jgi:hypothetical protein
MGKPNAQVQLIHALRRIRELEYELANARLVTTLFCDDAVVIAAHRVIKRRGKIIHDLSEEYKRITQEIAKLAVEDSKTEFKVGRYLEYAKETIDGEVKDALTEEYFQPFDVRHGLVGNAI